MFKHYLTTALRHLKHHKLTTGINVTCLVIGIASFLVIQAIVTYFQATDRQLPHSDRVYAITERMSFPGSSFSVPMVPYSGGLVAKYLKAEMPELGGVARATVGLDTPIAVDDTTQFSYVSYVDPDFLDIVELPLLAGDRHAALHAPRSAVLSDELAMRIFGSADRAIGRRLSLQGNQDVTVTAVLHPISQPSNMGSAERRALRFDLLVTMDVYESLATTNVLAQSNLENWQIGELFTYVLLPKDGTLTAVTLQERLKTFAAPHLPKGTFNIELGATPITHVRLAQMNAAFGTDKTGVPASTVLLILAILVLLISCLNYANLATAQAATRAKEVGMRRVVGASRLQIAMQHFVEAGLIALIALAIAIALTLFLVKALPLPEILHVTLSLGLSPSLWALLATVWITVTVAAGAYPAFVLSNVRPIQAVRTGRTKLGARFVASLLVGAQFAAASFLLIAILVMGAQNRAMKQSAIARIGDPVVVIANDVKAAGVDLDVLLKELRRQPHVVAATATFNVPWGIASCGQEIVTTTPSSNASRVAVCGNKIADDFFAAYDFRLLAGRLFDRDRADEYGQRATSSAVIDQALIAQHGWLSAQEAIGKRIYLNDWNGRNPPYPLDIVGVVDNHSMAPLGFGAISNVYTLNRPIAAVPSVRISNGDIPNALKEIEATWKAQAPRVALKWRFTDDLMNETYNLFTTLNAAFTGVALFAFIIAVLGLIGMSIHIIGRRTHEIGVRKTLGANVRQILVLLLKDFSKPVLAANLIAWPLAFFAMQVYLNIFTDRVALNLLPFASSLALTMLIAWCAVSIQATRAARMNPATVLRYE